MEGFFKQIAIDRPLGKTKYFAIRVEFQVRGSPYIHCFIWIFNAPVINDNNVDEYVSFLDKIVHAYLPSKREQTDFHELVKIVPTP